MSAKYDSVKDFYDKGLWSVAKVATAVKKGWITSDEFTKITGQKYKA